MKMGFAFCVVARLSDYMRSRKVERKWKMDLIFSPGW